MLVVPEEFNRNSITVTSLMTPEQSGVWLLERMRRQIGFESYAQKKLLDFGCGVRFSQAIISSDGQLFFTCFLDQAINTFEDRSPELNGGRCFYNPDFLTELVESCGWREVGRGPAEGPLIGDSFVYQRA